MNWKLLWLTATAALFLWLATAGVHARYDERIDYLTICINKNAREILVSGRSVRIFDAELDTPLYRVDGWHTHRMRASPEGIWVDGHIFDTSRLRIRSTEDRLEYKGHVFREEMLVVRLPDDPNRLALVNEIQLERYLYGLINKEVLPGWPLEAKKAQAVAARSYALYNKINRPRPVCDLDAGVYDQMYGGLSAEDSSARRAVDDTRGEVLVYKNQVIQAFYHSTCGGRTASSASIWNDPRPYLPSVEDGYCKSSPAYRWNYSIEKAGMGALLGVPKRLGENFLFDIAARDESGRVTKARVRHGGRTLVLTGEKLRKKLGYGKLKSTAFSFTVSKGIVTFTGRGLGHGVGMCQWGAAGMAEKGLGYRTILKHFYPNTKVRRLY